MSKRDITELGIKMVDRWTLSCRHATKPSVYPLKIAMAITTRAFSRVQAAVRRRGKACACKVRTYVRTYVYREDPRRWIAALLNCLNGYRTDSIAATREPALISMGIVNPLGGGIYYFQVSFGQIDSIIIWDVYFLFLHILIRWRIFSDIIYLWRGI